MKVIFAFMLLFVAFSAVALAENSFERAVMDLVVARDEQRECGTLFSGCSTHADCCEGFICKLWCKYERTWGK
uniref:Secretory peptide n=1 Tax=Heteropoda venatoria TaxID=152925 RepID=A0A088BP76_HETVE|nr:secretory peptide [Heteropoda venatoria]